MSFQKAKDYCSLGRFMRRWLGMAVLYPLDIRGYIGRKEWPRREAEAFTRKGHLRFPSLVYPILPFFGRPAFWRRGGVFSCRDRKNARGQAWYSFADMISVCVRVAADVPFDVDGYFAQRGSLFTLLRAADFLQPCVKNGWQCPFDFRSDQPNGIQITDMNAIDIAVVADLHLDEVQNGNDGDFDAMDR